MSKLNKLNILVAFPYFSQSIFKSLSEKDPSTFRLIVDSGAFTAWNTGKNINFNDYLKFLKTIPNNWDYKAVQLDVFGNAEATYINYIKMLQLGFKDIMPVFTRGDSLERLEEFYTYTDYIMFGGIVIGGENKNYVKWFCENNKNRKTHWLGFVNMPFIKKYKPTSVDSSSWRSAARFGNIAYYDGKGEISTINKTVFLKKPNDIVMEGLKRVGLTEKEILLLGQQSSWSDSGYHDGNLNEPKKSTAQFINTLAHVLRAIEVEKKLATHIYIAVSNDSHLRLLLKAYEFLTDRNIIKEIK